MTTKQTTTQYLRTLAIVTLLSISSGAHALCVNGDGSLDDSSMNTASIDRGLLPACEIEKAAPDQVSQPQAVKTQEPIAKPAGETHKAVKKAKRPDQTASVQGDCRTASGESREGTLGALDMLPACGV